MNMNILKASLLASAIALGAGAVTGCATDGRGASKASNQPVGDAGITAAVKAALLADTRTEGFDINVETLNGVVTLTGGADTASDKAAATTLAAATAGVVSVDNRIIVAADGSALRTAANEATASGDVRAAVEDVTDGVDEEGNNPKLNDLDGDGVDEVGPGPDAPVNDQIGAVDGDDDVLDADRKEAGEVDDANDLLGDKVDDDRMGDGTGGPSDAVDDAWITSKVKTQFLADTAVEGLEIDVDTQANVVTLSGSVDTAAQREAAIRIATATQGVQKVVADALIVAAD